MNKIKPKDDSSGERAGLRGNLKFPSQPGRFSLNPKYITKRQAAKFVNKDPEMIARWVARGWLKPHRIGGRTVYELAEVNGAFVAEVVRGKEVAREEILYAAWVERQEILLAENRVLQEAIDRENRVSSHRAKQKTGRRC